MRRRRAILVAWLLPFIGAACPDPVYERDVQIDVPESTQATVAAYPQQLRFSSYGDVYLIGVLCAAGPETFVATGKIRSSLVPEEVEVTAWLTPGTSDPPSCGPIPFDYRTHAPGPSSPAPGEPHASGVFSTKGGVAVLTLTGP